MMHILAAGTAGRRRAPTRWSPRWPELIIGAIAFLIVFGVLYKVLMPRIQKTLAERTDAIEGGLQRAEEAQAEAARTLEQYQAQLAEARHEASRLREEAQRAGRPDHRRDARAGPGRGAPDHRGRAGPAGGRPAAGPGRAARRRSAPCPSSWPARSSASRWPTRPGRAGWSTGSWTSWRPSPSAPGRRAPRTRHERREPGHRWPRPRSGWPRMAAGRPARASWATSCSRWSACWTASRRCGGRWPTPSSARDARAGPGRRAARAAGQRANRRAGQLAWPPPRGPARLTWPTRSSSWPSWPWSPRPTRPGSWTTWKTSCSGSPGSLGAQPELRAALSNPFAPAEAKQQLVDTLLADKATPQTVQLVTQAALHPRGRSLDWEPGRIRAARGRVPGAAGRRGPRRDRAQRRAAGPPGDRCWPRPTGTRCTSTWCSTPRSSAG